MTNSPDMLELYCARALMNSQTARDRFQELGASAADLFDDETLRVIAEWCISGGEATPETKTVLERGQYPDIVQLMADPVPIDDEWACSLIGTLAEDRMGTWLPPTLRWGADAVERGENPSDIYTQIDRAFRQAGVAKREVA